MSIVVPTHVFLQELMVEGLAAGTREIGFWITGKGCSALAKITEVLARPGHTMETDA